MNQKVFITTSNGNVTSYACSTGWLLKLWEIVTKKGLLVISASDKWKPSALEQYIGEW